MGRTEKGDFPPLHWGTEKKKPFFAKPLGKLLLALAAIAFTINLFGEEFSTQSRAIVETAYETFGYTYEGAIACSGNGVSIKGKCLCNLGYNGLKCSDKSPSEFLDPTPNSVLIVTANFGPLNSEKDLEAENSYALALQMRHAGYLVNVLYIGDESSSNFVKHQNRIIADGLTFNKLSSFSTGLNYDGNDIEGRSYEVYQYLISKAEPYAIVHFSAASGAGFYTLKAQKQGLLCFKTKFIVGVDRLPPSRTLKLENSDEHLIISDVNTLKLDYVQQKSIELASNVVVYSKLLLKSLRALNWQFPPSTHVIGSLPTSSIEGPKGKYVTVKEFVYVGDFNLINGIKIFADSVSLIAEEIGAAGISISFVGIPRTIEDLSFKDWIELHASNWEENGIKWKVVATEGSKQILEYIAEKDGRVAVLPSLYTPSPIIARELLYGHFPFIASSKNAVVEKIHKSDKANVIIKPTTNELTDRLLSVVEAKKALIPKPSNEKDDASLDWITIYDKLTTSKFEQCSSINDVVQNLPLVSVVLVHHNRGKFLRQAIKSIEAQTYKNVEVILVDDGSTDKESLMILEEITRNWDETKGWKVLREKNKYLGAARNTGVSRASGEFVLFMDDDDVAKPHQIATFVKVALKTKAQVVTSGHDVFTGKSSPYSGISNKRYLPLGDAVMAGMLQNVFGDSKMLVNKESFLRAGGFTEEFGVGFEDYEFLAKAVLNQDTTVEAISEPLNWYRRHDDTISYQTNLKANQLRMLRAYVTANESAPKEQRALLQYTSELFFDRHGSRGIQLEEAQGTDTDYATNTEDGRGTSTETGTDTNTETGTDTLTETGTDTKTETENTETESATTTDAETATTTTDFGPTVTNVIPECDDPDCYGLCPGEVDYGYVIDCSDFCVPKDQAWVKDDCNVCNGGNVSCADCAGVPNGDAKKDACNVCNGNGDCDAVVVGVEPAVCANAAGSKFYVYGAGLADATINFLTPDVVATVKVVEDQNNQFIEITLDEPLSQEFEGVPKIYDTTEINFFVQIDGVSIGAKQTIIVYKTELGTLNSAIPDAIDVGESSVITIFGTFLDFPGAQCVFDYNETGVATTAVLIDGNYQCEAPIFETSGDYTFHLQYYTPQYPTPDYPKTNFARRPGCYLTDPAGGPLSLKVIALAPTYLSAVFTPSGTAIDVTFDKAVAIVNEAVHADTGLSEILIGDIPCNVAFTHKDGLLGVDALDCSISQITSDTLRLYLKGSFTLNSAAIVPGEFIKFDLIAAAQETYSYLASGDAYVDVSTTPTTPDASLVFYPKVISQCQDLTLDFSGIPGSAGRRWKSVKIDVGAITDTSFIAELARLEETIVDGVHVAVIARSFLSFPETYLFTITMKNWLDQESVTIIEVKTQTENVPYVIVKNSNSYANNEVSLETLLNAEMIPTCDITTPAVFEWSYTGDDGIVSVNQSQLNISPFTLTRGQTYNMSLRAGFAGGVLFDLGSYEIKTNDFFQVSAGSSRVVGTENTTRLVPNISSYLYPAPAEEQPAYSCTWVCESTTGESCLKTDGLPVDYDLTSSLICDEQGVEVPTLRSGSYNFKVTVKNVSTFEETTSDPLLVFVKPGFYPSVSIASSEEWPSVYSDTFSLSAIQDLSSTLNTVDVSYSWTSESNCGFNTYVTFDLNDSTTLTGTTEPTLKFVPGALEPSTTYCFKVEATEPAQTLVGESFIVIKTSDAPNGGDCVLIAESIVAPDDSSSITDTSSLAEAISIQCDAWSSPDFETSASPLAYQLSIKDLGSDSDFEVITPWAPSSDFSTSVPVGEFEVKVSIKDMLGNTNMSEKVFVVGEAVENTTTFLSKRVPFEQSIDIFINEALIKYQLTSDVNRALTNAAVVAASLPSHLADEHPAATQSLLVKFVKTIIESKNWYLDAKSASIAGTIVSNLVGDEYKLKKVQSESVFSLLDQITGIIKDTSPTSCYKASTSNQFAKAVDGILASLARAGDLSPVVKTTYNSLMNKLTSCQLNIQSCGQTTSYIGTALSYSVGVANTYNTSEICDYILTGFNKGCQAFTCGKQLASGFVDVNEKALSNVFDSLTIYYEGVPFVGDYQGLGSAAGAITAEHDFFDKYSGEGWIPTVTRVKFEDNTQNWTTASFNEDNVENTGNSEKDYRYKTKQNGFFALQARREEIIYKACENGQTSDCKGNCQGDVNYGYYLDCFNHCSAPQLGAFEDDCGVCGGNNNSCKDCFDVVNGPAIEDVCKVCDGNGDTCFAFAGIEPKVAPVGKPAPIVLYGAGFSDGITVSRTSGDETTATILADTEFTVVSNNEIHVSIADITLVGTTLTQTYNILQGTTSLSATVTLYDESGMTVESVTPTQVTAGTTSVLTLSGQNLLEVEGTLCLFNLNSSGFVATAATYGSNVITCNTPDFNQNGGDVEVQLMYSTPQFRTTLFPDLKNYNRSTLFVPTIAAGLSLRVVASAPIVTASKFSNSGATITVLFNKPISVIDPTVYSNENGKLTPAEWTGYCNLMFDTSQEVNGKLVTDVNSQSDCKISLSGPSEVTISFNPLFTESGSAIIPGEQLTIATNAVAAAGAKYSLTAEGVSVVAGPDILPLPVVVAQGPTIISLCPDYTMDLSASYGSAGRPWKGISIVSDPVVASLDAALATQVAKILAGGVNEVVLTPAEMPAGAYTFTVGFTNFLDGVSSVEIQVERLSNDDVPYVVLSSDKGTTGLEVQQVHTIRAKGIPQCGVVKTINYSWSFVGGTTVVAIPASEASSPIINLPKNSMEPSGTITNTYTYQVAANYADTPGSVFTFQITVETAPDLIQTNAGASRTVGVAQTLTLDATIINKTYDRKTNWPIFECSWSCIDTRTLRDCHSETEDATLVLPFGNACENIDITGQLKAGLEYKFVVTATNTATGNSAVGDPTYITIAPRNVPVLTITANDLNPGAWSEDFSLTAVVDPSTVTGTITYTWSSQSECNGEQYSAVNLEENVTTSTPITNNGLRLLPGKVSPGSVYCFQVVVTDSADPTISGVGSLIVPFKNAPIGGSCKRIGADGYATFTDNYVISCNNWVTDSASVPLSYSFDIRASGTTDAFQPLRSKNPSGKLSSVGYYAGVYEIRATIWDEAKSQTQFIVAEVVTITEAPVTKKLFKRTPQQVIAQLGSSQATFEAVQDPQAAISDISNAISQGTDKTDPDAAAIAVASMTYTKAVLESGILTINNDNVNAQTVSEILKAAIGSTYPLKQENVEITFEVASLALTQVSAANFVANAAIGGNFAAVLDAALFSTAANNEYSVRLASDLYTAEQNLVVAVRSAMICGQTLFEFSNPDGSTSYTIGVVNSQTTDLGVVNALNWSSNATPAIANDECVSIFGRIADVAGVLTSTQQEGISTVLGSIEFSSVVDGTVIVINGAELVYTLEPTAIPVIEGKDTSLAVSSYTFGGDKSYANIVSAKLSSSVANVDGGVTTNQSGMVGIIIESKDAVTPGCTTDCPPTDPPVDPPVDPEESNSTGAIIGGTLASIAVIAGAVAFGAVRHKRKKEEEASNYTGNARNTEQSVAINMGDAVVQHRESEVQQEQVPEQISRGASEEVAGLDSVSVLPLDSNAVQTGPIRSPELLPGYNLHPTYVGFMATRT